MRRSVDCTTAMTTVDAPAVPHRYVDIADEGPAHHAQASVASSIASWGSDQRGVRGSPQSRVTATTPPT